MGGADNRAFLFDIFGTVVDWRSGVAAFAAPFLEERGIALDPFEFADLWRAEYQPAMQRIRSGGRPYVALDTLHLENLDRVLEKTGLNVAFDNKARQALNQAWEHLPPWPDSVQGIARLRDRFIVAPCSNGSIALMTRLARHAGLTWDCILGADIARDYKPRLEVYQACCQALQLPPENVVMVAAHNDDLVAARKAGLATAFIPRPREHGDSQKTDLEPVDSWDMVANSLTELAEIA